MLKAKGRKQKADVLPDDILLQDLNWHVPRELTFLETKAHMQSLVQTCRLKIQALDKDKREVVGDFKKKLLTIKEGNHSDKTFIEQMVMLVERKRREKIKVNVEKGTVFIYQ